ncbi:MAG: hypothetical protein NC098_01795 [Lachnoclostridium sp.]|nr:hypothetical protein [Lachnoclostridium sp.]
MKLTTLLSLIILLLTTFAARAEGWAGCASVYTAGDYDLTGGGDGSMIVLRSNGGDMKSAIAQAINSHDVIIFDGIDGEFEVSSYINFLSLKNKTLIGVNGACLRTTYAVTDEVRQMLDEINVNSLSQNADDDMGGTLSNGSFVAELREFTIRQAMIDRFGDPSEPYRNAGIFHFINGSNIIIRNIDFIGPGSLDVGGFDLLTLNACDHVWVDQCRFTDGLDGNLDIILNSDFITISDTHFRYTSRSYNHQLSSLNSGSEITDGSPQKNNVSWIRCFWGEGCTGRMPFTYMGIHHIVNCFWDCTKGTCIDAHDGSRLLVENNYFTSKVKTPVKLTGKGILEDCRGNICEGKSPLMSSATISVPYDYDMIDAVSVPEVVKLAGPKLEYSYTRPLTASPAVVDLGSVYIDNQVESIINLSAYGQGIPSQVTITAPEGVLLSATRDGDYKTEVTVNATDRNLLQADIYIKASFATSGSAEKLIYVTTADSSFTIPVRADVAALEGEAVNVTLVWSFEKGTTSPSDAATDHPDLFSNASYYLGDKIYIHASKNISQLTFTLFNPTEEIGKVVDPDCYLSFNVTAAQGFTFVPEKLTFNASRIATDMCFVDIEATRGDNSPVRLATSFQPARSSDSPFYTTVELPLGGTGVGDDLRIKLYLYNILANKQLALNGVTIQGKIYTSSAASPVIATEETPTAAEYYDLQGRKVLHPRSGDLYILRSGISPARLIIYCGN